MLTVAGMVAVVNSVVLAACAGLVVERLGVGPIAIPVAAGAVVGAVALSLHERHHRRARGAYSPQAVDRAAIFIPPPVHDATGPSRADDHVTGHNWSSTSCEHRNGRQGHDNDPR